MPFGCFWHFRLESRLSFVQFVVLSAVALGNAGGQKVIIALVGISSGMEPFHLLDDGCCNVE